MTLNQLQTCPSPPFSDERHQLLLPFPQPSPTAPANARRALPSTPSQSPLFPQFLFPKFSKGTADRPPPLPLPNPTTRIYLSIVMPVVSPPNTRSLRTDTSPHRLFPEIIWCKIQPPDAYHLSRDQSPYHHGLLCALSHIFSQTVDPRTFFRRFLQVGDYY